jgi:hypothetical protein
MPVPLISVSALFHNPSVSKPLSLATELSSIALIADLARSSSMSFPAALRYTSPEQASEQIMKFVAVRPFERFGRLLNTLESRWSLYALVQGSGLVASFSLPAWAVKSGQISQYAPLSWVVAGFAGMLIWAIVRLIWNWAYQIKIRAQYDARFLDRSGNYNPLDLTFEKKRIDHRLFLQKLRSQRDVCLS